MDTTKETSLSKAIIDHSLISLPEEEDKERVWIRAIAEVEKIDGNKSYVYAELDPDTLKKVIKKDYGSCTQIHKVLRYYPFCYLDEIYLPNFKKEKETDEQVAAKIVSYFKATTGNDYSGESLQKLNKRVLGLAVKNQLSVEKAADSCKKTKSQKNGKESVEKKAGKSGKSNRAK